MKLLHSYWEMLTRILQELKNGKFEKVVQQTASLAEQLMFLKQNADSRQVIALLSGLQLCCILRLGCCSDIRGTLSHKSMISE